MANKIDYLVATNPINVKKEKAGSDKHENRIQYKGEQSFVYLVGLAGSLAESYQDFHTDGQLKRTVSFYKFGTHKDARKVMLC